MVEEDTIRLLRECNAGVKMGIDAIDQVLPKVEDRDLMKALEHSRSVHSSLGEKTRTLLNEYHDSGKEPSGMAKAMSQVKTSFQMLSSSNRDQAAANLITDGCDMGMKSLGRYLNQYEAAQEKAKDIAKSLIEEEEDLVKNIRPYL